MNKNEIKKTAKEIAKYYKYTAITKSFFIDEQTAIFNAFDECGTCFEFYIDFQSGYATKQTLSGVMVHEQNDISDWLTTFFKFN